MEEEVVITEGIIQRGQSERGGWTKQQLAILGIRWPPPKGWKKKVVGKLKLKRSRVESFLALRLMR